VVICLQQGADLYGLADATAVKSKLVLPFRYWLTWVVPEKEPLNGCVCVCVCFWRIIMSTNRRLGRIWKKTEAYH